MQKTFCDKCEQEIDMERLNEYIYHISADLQSLAGGSPKSTGRLEICEKCWKDHFRELFPIGQESALYERVTETFSKWKEGSKDIPPQPEPVVI